MYINNKQTVSVSFILVYKKICLIIKLRKVYKILLIGECL